MELTTRQRRALIFAATAIAIVALWSTPVLYPLRLFVVFLHETSHALAALATGGAVVRISIDPGEGGYTLTRGGSALLTLSAGYLGSLAWGAAILLAARSRRAGGVAVALGLAVLVVTALYVRNPFGLAFGILFGLAAVAAGRRLSHAVVAWLLMVVGMTSCLYAPLDIWSDVLARPGLHSDAAMLASMTHVPTIVWGILWLAISLAVSWRLFRSGLSGR